MSSRVKIDVYLRKEDKAKIKKKALKLDLSLSDYLRLKALDKIKEDE
jgi:hypothetical protein